MGQMVRETELYAPIKSFLEGQGYEVKSEIGPADVVALREGDPPVVVELKTGFSLSLVHQAVARQAVTELVYVAVPRKQGKPFLAAIKRSFSPSNRKQSANAPSSRAIVCSAASRGANP